MLVGDLRRTYFEYQADKQLVEMYQRIVRSTGASHLSATKMRQAGGVRQLDVLSERSIHEQAKVDLNAAVEHLASNREAMNALMGLWGDQLYLQTPARLPDLPAGELPVSASPTTQRSDATDPVEAITPGEYPKMFPPMQRMVVPEGMTPEAQKQKMMKMMSPPPATPQQRADGLAGGPTTRDASAHAPSVLGNNNPIGKPPLASTQPSAARFADVERAAVSRNLDLAAARFLIDAQAYRLKLDFARAAVPSANVGLDGQKERDKTVWGVGPGGSVKIPIFDPGQGAYPREESR